MSSSRFSVELPPATVENPSDTYAGGLAHLWSRYRSALLPISALAIVAIVVLRGIGIGEFNLGVDEAHHAFTGLFVSDFLRHLPLLHPVEYTYVYYAQYPVLGLVHWPPFFQFVEGVAFLMLGPSVVTARLTVLLFALVGLYFWFRLVREFSSGRVAVVATILLGTLPGAILYEKSVMLEIPSLALSMVAVYYWLRYLRAENPASLYAFAVLAGMALLTKQQSIFLAPFCLLTVLSERRWRLVLRWRTAKAFLVVLAMTAPFYGLVFTLHERDVSDAVLMGNRTVAHPWAYYWSVLPHQLGWPVLALAALGVGTWKWWGNRQNHLTMIMWILACYVTFTPLALKEPRYILDWLPPFAYFAAGLLTLRQDRWRMIRLAAAGAVVAIAAMSFWNAWRYQRPYVSGYAAAAEQIARSGHPGIVLYDGDLCANFCFFLRVSDPGRHYVILRKELYVTDNAKIFGGVELVHTRQELATLFEQYGIRYAVVEDGIHLDFPIQQTLREYLSGDQFKPPKLFPITGRYPSWQANALQVYENRNPRPSTVTVLRLRMLSLPYDIVVPLSKLLKQ